MEIAAAKDPTNFVRIATALIPSWRSRDQSALFAQRMSVAELNTMLGLIDAIKDRLPQAGTMKPEAVFEYVGRALDAYDEPKLIPARA
jgi:hypothetical protein